MRRPLFVALLFSSLVACGGTNFPDPKSTAPSPPSENDAAYQVRGVRNWALIGNDLDPGHSSFPLHVVAPNGTDYVDYWLNSDTGVRLEKKSDGFHTDLDLSSLPPGEHTLTFAANGADQAFAQLRFTRTHPLYVVVTTDWDDADTLDSALELQDELHAEHPDLLLTHFVGPYTFTDPELTEERREILVNWLKAQRDNFGDEIGLHIHPYCNFVDQVDEILGIDPIECNTEASTVYSSDSTGYTVQCAAYSEEDFTNLLLASDALFEERGLGKPTSFRAGGWTADLSTMKALENAGYVADTSANNWARMEEWDTPRSGTLYRWNMENWSSINDTSQPYYPSTEDILVPGDEDIGVLEVPDNGILVDYVSQYEMIEIFAANWPGGALDAPTNYSIGYHPSNFNITYKQRMSAIFTHLDRYLAVNDQGPVVYGLLSDMPKVWKRSE